ncbi:YhfZ family protein [Enterococcus termitis]|uniref:HTH gntR-type domain-containing protein n=1 Tax=Enterococcus termitis TaxID=332950 RepID=A0A1E5GVC7_9ENTE|nr:YhfZ family protein [Enterococcus termitis]OEG16656.1 hypothetical protein BCR25_03395 [Enterococcus termitis]
MYLSQKGRAQQKLAEVFLSCKIGDQVPTFNDLHKEFKVGTGTIQSALKEFETNGIVQLKAQPRYGTTLVGKDVEKLWQFLPKKHVIGLFPEPFSLEMQGLAMGLREAFQELGIPLIIVYGYGSKVRFDRILSEQHTEDFVISSFASAKDRQLINPELDVALRFKENSFYQKESLLVLENEQIQKKKEIKIGIDYSSFDHMLLTKMVFPDASYVDIKYSDVPYEVLTNIVDTAIWHRTIQPKFVSGKVISIGSCGKEMDNLKLTEVSEAVLTINSNTKLMKGVLEHIDCAKVIDIQKKVLAQEIQPIF